MDIYGRFIYKVKTSTILKGFENKIITNKLKTSILNAETQYD